MEGSPYGNFCYGYSAGAESTEATVTIKPERNLLSAILSRAIADAYTNSHIERHIRRDARRWISAKVNLRKAFSFGWCCTHIDLDPEKIKNILSQLSHCPDQMQLLINHLR